MKGESKMAVALRKEELERIDEEMGKLRLVPGGQTEKAGRVEYEFPYDDLHQMYDYITNEMGIK
jgi:hypothetical protein